MIYSHFQLRRLRVVKSGAAAYDEKFHSGLNIIRGENGSGKSTIADFIFYILGGEFDNWKTIASTCHEVQAEILAASTVLTLRREIGTAQTPIQVFFGPMTDAEKHGLDGWERYPIRRRDSQESFSQIMFRASGIPEAQSQGASNITMHQILRLLYADQRTPAAFLFRYESFDTREIREAVGDLLCGLSVYEMYEAELLLRNLEKRFDDKNRRFSSLLSGLSPDEAVWRVEGIESRLEELRVEAERIAREAADPDQYVDGAEVDAYIRGRAELVKEIRTLREKLGLIEEQAHILDLELSELTAFINYLDELADKIGRAKGTYDIVGSIEFSHCPACLAELNEIHGPGHCVVCGSETNPERENSRYLQIKLDLEIQIRESRQLLEEKLRASDQSKREARHFKRDHEEKVTEFAVRYQYSTSPRDAFVAQRYQRLGQIDRERKQLDHMRERALELTKLSAEKAELQLEINRIKDRLQALEVAGRQRRSQALTRVSDIAKLLLRDDIDRQDEFKSVQNVSLNFPDNSILVDGELNFAESSNVIVKNSAILALFVAACRDEKFFHPRFALFDNIEDKGMEVARSHNFQRLIAAASAGLKISHQIIFTTSMIDPVLDKDEFVVGPSYTHARRTLNIQQASSGFDSRSDSNSKG